MACERDNPNVIPTEYFTVSCFLQEPPGEAGELIKDENDSQNCLSRL